MHTLAEGVYQQPQCGTGRASKPIHGAAERERHTLLVRRGVLPSTGFLRKLPTLSQVGACGGEQCPALPPRLTQHVPADSGNNNQTRGGPEVRLPYTHTVDWRAAEG
ncbi:hypothetical protein E2C01_036297 [Portunus trituberculatus]|uniref:Uncharacterized protein n=1 Tax=Portunus trituberculatus TaxID=210409 RepID=A0A5B7F6E3_PORTR|nr:hypothetical protein [Portunus trituberculatus]